MLVRLLCGKCAISAWIIFSLIDKCGSSMTLWQKGGFIYTSEEFSKVYVACIILLQNFNNSQIVKEFGCSL